MKKVVLYSLFFVMGTACNESSTDSTKQVEHSAEVKPDIVTSTPLTSSWKGIQKMNDEDFSKKMAATPGLTVVDFSAEWCGPCKLLHPILVSLANEMEGKVNFGNVDVDESPNIATELAITGIPLLVFYKNGKIVDKIIGLLPKEDLKAKINQHL